MGIIVNKDQDQNTDLTRRIAADLRDKNFNSSVEGEKSPDLAEDSEYVRDFKKTNKYSWIWAVLIVLALISLIIICVF